MLFFPCVEEGYPGLLFNIFRDGVLAGTVCIPDSEQEPSVVSLVLEEFKRLKWPPSEVSVQPKGGETLVNLDTIFSTMNKQPTSVTVSLLSKHVTIVATPVSYAWSFGDGATMTTATGGNPYPARDITHIYTTTKDVKVSVATTYSGKYKVGDGKWKDIDETLTVDGPVARLSVLEAKPQLVLR